jgi:RNA polymerase sigma-70 factor (ECF subfamily)
MHPESGEPDDSSGMGEEGSDAVLLAAAAKGDRNAFGAIVERHHGLVYRVAWRMTAGHADTEDIVQETFLKLWNSPAQVRHGVALRAWLIRVATNLAIDRARRKPMTDIDAIPEPEDDEPDALDRVIGEGSVNEVDAAIAGLPDRQRLALVLVHFENMSNIEAARAMDVSVEAIESLLARARRSLKIALAGRWRDLLADLGQLSH